MMDEMTFNFDLEDTEDPATVIKSEIKKIAVVTKGYVSGNLDEYSGEIKSYSYQKKSGLLAATEILNEKTEVYVNVQDSLGEQSEADNRYEVYLTVKGLEAYRYRMMLMDYGDISYPVTIVLARDFVEECSPQYTDTFEIATMKGLTDLMHKIFDSSFFRSLIQSLINEAIRRERINSSSND